MKRSIPRSLVGRSAPAPENGGQSDDVEDAPSTESTPAAPTAGSKPPLPGASTGDFRGAGSAWKSGALAQSQSAVERIREKLIVDILDGRHELSISPDQITDPLGTDRRANWMEQDAFATLLDSIELNGQDTPITVWPEDPAWTPDPLSPTSVGGVKFVLLTGRRRHAAAEQLGLKLRAIIAPTCERQSDRHRFEMLFLRYRENEERENLGAFERLLSIGEMYETLSGADADASLTAVSFAKRIGVHESIVSRARASYAAKDRILNAFKNAYDMSYKDIQDVLKTLDERPKLASKTKPVTLLVKRKIGSRNLSASATAGTISIKATGIKMDQARLEGLSDLIAGYLNDLEENG